nr:hypothetical protein [Tanacetum cinerariifolium]
MLVLWTLYTRDCSCSKGNVEDKILVPKPPRNCARCGHPVDGSYCQGCALLRKELEEDLVTHFQDFQNTSESSDDNTTVVNAPREPFVVKQDQGSFVDKLICDLHTFSINQHHCFHCKDVLRDGKACQRCTCFDQTQPPQSPVIHSPPQETSIEILHDQEKITPLQSHPFYPPRSPTTPHLDTIPTTESDEVIKSSVKDLVSILSESEGIPDTMCDVHLVNNPTPLEAKDHFEIIINSNDDYSSSDDDSLYYKNIEYVEASPHDSELVSLEVKKIVISEDEDIEDDNLHEKLLKVNLLIAKIEALRDNPTPSSKFLTKSSSTSPKSFLEETNTFDNSLPEFENFCFDLEEISSGSTTTYSDLSLSEYKAFSFYDDHIEEIRSGSTTTTSDISLFEYDSFIFDFSNDQFPPTDRSDSTHEEFVNEPAHIISPPEYDCFYFRNLADPGELISSLHFGICKNLSSTTRVILPVEDDY